LLKLLGVEQHPVVEWWSLFY